MSSVFEHNANVPKILYNRFKTIKLPESIKYACMNDILKWYHSNGVDFTVERLKFIKQCVVNYAADPANEIPVGPEFPWVAKQNKRLFAKHWGELQKRASSGPKAMKEVGKILQAYTCLSRRVTVKDVLKWKDDVLAPSSAKDLSSFVTLMSDAAKTIKQHVSPIYLSDVKYQDEVYLFTGEFKPHHEEAYQEQIFSVFSEAMVDKIWKNHPPQFWSPFIVSCFADEEQEKQYADSISQGVINLVVEPGCKFRFVLNHFKPMEFMLQPLGKRLYQLVEEVPWDSTFHEAYGYRVIQSALKQGKTCYCFDLSSATDRFPFELQLALLRELNFGPVWSSMVDLAEELYRLPADIGKIPGIQEDLGQVSWTVGQPMGAYPSFAMFSLAHGALLVALAGGKYTGQFIVHGDDLVIMDEVLAEKYKDFLENSGVKFNPTKTIISSNFAEMNSKLIYTNHIVDMRKWRPINKSNVLDHIDYWGPSVLNWVYSDELTKQSKRSKALDKIRFITDKVLTIPGILPNGNSLNPLGIDIDTRLKHVPDELLMKKSEIVDYGMVTQETMLKRIGPGPSSDHADIVALLKSLRTEAEQAKVHSVVQGQPLLETLNNQHPSLALSALREQTSLVRDRYGSWYKMNLPTLKRNQHQTRPTVRIEDLTKSVMALEALEEG